MKMTLILLIALETVSLGQSPFRRGVGQVNGLPGITVIDARQHTPRGVRNAVDFYQMPRLTGPLQIIESESVVLTYHPDWFTAHAEGDPQKSVNPTYIQQNGFYFVKGDPRQEVLIQFVTGQLAVIKKSTRPNAPVNNLIGLGSYGSIEGLRGAVILNRLGNPVERQQTQGGGEDWLYYQAVSQNSQKTLTSDQVTSGMIGNDFVGLNTRSETTVTLQRPLVLWNFTINFTSDANGDLRVRGLRSGQTGPGEWKIVPAP
jgi:hypothetical protein